MDIEVRVTSAEAQFIYVRLDDDLHSYVVQIADVEFHGLPRWALADLRERISAELDPPQKATD
jgi:hypothetical protein